MATNDNLKAAFAGESQANRKYLAFAKKADSEGKPQLAKLFRATAEAETIHAHSHLRAMKGVKSSAENLQEAIAGEGYEFKEMYPPMLAEANKEGQKAAALSFDYALQAEKVHHQLFTQAAEALQKGQDFAAGKIQICTVCGHTQIGEAPDKCPLCKAAKEKYTEIK